MTTHHDAVVVPCYDEADRLAIHAIESLADEHSLVVLVDDGSNDGTPALLRRMAAGRPAAFRVVELQPNRGKGEAVRAGMLTALEADVAAVGYLDADMATPVEEYHRLSRTLTERPDVDAVIGSRVALAGHRIDRTQRRHYLGRLYATAASIVLGRAVYDTQCGAKVFRVTPALRAALSEPFVDRWSFDVELLGRVLRDDEASVLEVPLRSWSDVPGSKLGLRQSIRAAWSLVRVSRRLHHAGVPSDQTEPGGARKTETG